MPEDQYTPHLGHQCLKCGGEERVVHKRWCQTCIEAPRKVREAHLAAMQQVDMAYKSSTPLIPALVRAADERPAKMCHRCGSARWLEHSPGSWQCEVCGISPW